MRLNRDYTSFRQKASQRSISNLAIYLDYILQNHTNTVRYNISMNVESIQCGLIHYIRQPRPFACASCTSIGTACKKKYIAGRSAHIIALGSAGSPVLCLQRSSAIFTVTARNIYSECRKSSTHGSTTYIRTQRPTTQ